MSFSTALSGLNAATADLNVKSNNIANVNTTGFKVSRAEFGDVFAVSAFGTSGKTAIGSGVVLTNVAQQFNQGNLEFTDNSLDLAISGEGFFAMAPELDSGEVTYTRSGAFGIDNSGYMVNAQGEFLRTFPVDGDGNISATSMSAAKPLQLPPSAGAPEPTTQLSIATNLPSNASVLNDGTGVALVGGSNTQTITGLNFGAAGGFDVDTTTVGLNGTYTEASLVAEIQSDLGSNYSVSSTGSVATNNFNVTITDIVDLNYYSRNLQSQSNDSDADGSNPHIGNGIFNLGALPQKPEKAVIDGVMEYTTNKLINILPKGSRSEQQQKNFTSYARKNNKKSNIYDLKEKYRPLYQEVIDHFTAKQPISLKSDNLVFSYGTINNQNINDYTGALAFEKPEGSINLDQFLIFKDQLEEILSEIRLQVDYGDFNSNKVPLSEIDPRKCIHKKFQIFIKAILAKDKRIESGLLINYFFESSAPISPEDKKIITKILIAENVTPSVAGRANKKAYDDVLKIYTTWEEGLFPQEEWRFLLDMKRNNRILGCQPHESGQIPSSIPCDFCCN